MPTHAVRVFLQSLAKRRIPITYQELAKALQISPMGIDGACIAAEAAGPEEGFTALAALPTEAKQRLFAWCIAACLKPQLAIEDKADPVIECPVASRSHSPISGGRPPPIVGAA